ncbi:MAG: ATP-binding protein [Ketobacteraceae bacterium]|nr:ATP-binding protein [Ketobacteraceae bacterium]
MMTLNFTQKVWLGFVVILILLSISGASSLWNLSDINSASERVNDQAVPVVRKANQVQIQLLKIANQSALGYNAVREEQIAPYRDAFERGTVEFDRLYEDLYTLTQNDPSMHSQVIDIKSRYDTFRQSIRDMFKAKLDALVAKHRATEETQKLIERVGAVSDALMNISFYEAPPEDQEIQEFSAGVANEVDGKFFNVIKMAEELQRSTDPEKFATATDDILYVIQDAELFMGYLLRDFATIDPGGYVDSLLQTVEKLKQKVSAEETLVSFKKLQIRKSEEAAESFDAAQASVDKSVAGLDALLSVTDKKLGQLQQELSSDLDYGMKSTVVILIVLIALASQNFNSMRIAIRRKMQDLAQLNQIGSNLAAARSQDSALNEVLQAMHDKINIDKGSVFLFNRDNELEAKAFLPPMSFDSSERKAMSFTKGVGIIGRVAESKKTIFVQDTSKDSNYVAREGETAKSLLCVPLLDKDILMGVMSFSGDINGVSFADSDYEFVSTVAQSLVTTLKNISMVEVIEEQNRNLEHKVAQRTADLKQKNDDIANMLANMHQGLFTIEENGLVHPEYAAYLETIFQTKRIANRNFTDLLFEHAVMSEDAIDATVTAVGAVVGEDAMMYDFNSHLLAKEIRFRLPDQSQDRFLDLDWDPIVDDADTVVKLMVTVRDVTELRALQAEAEEQRQELNIIGEIIAVSPNKFLEFIETSDTFIARCRQTIETTNEKNPAVLAELFRNMHTVKGNARTYGFKGITETVHRVENTYDQLRKNDEAAWDANALLVELTIAENAVARYAGIFHDKLNLSGPAEVAGDSIEPSIAESLVERIAALDGQPVSGNVVSIVKDTYRALAGLNAKSLDRVIADVVDSVKSLARDLDKAEPVVSIDPGDVLLKARTHSMMNNIFMHVMRNAIDHGIEGPEERLKKGKPERGNIRILTHTDEEHVRFTVSDDGRGIALSRIYEKALENGLCAPDRPRPPDAEIANLIFSSGFSTADHVTEVSGRGVGMDAVRQFLESEGGHIEVVLTDYNEGGDFRSFNTVVSLPLSCCRIIPELTELAKAS